MSALPEQYRKYAAPHGQHAIHGEIELYDDRDPVVWVPNAYGQMVPMRRSQAPVPMVRPEPRDLTPQPLLDPLAQRLVAGGIGVGAAGAGVGFGLGQLAAGIALMGPSGLAILVGLLLAAGGLRRSTVTIHQEIHQRASWFSSNRVEQ